MARTFPTLHRQTVPDNTGREQLKQISVGDGRVFGEMEAVTARRGGGGEGSACSLGDDASVKEKDSSRSSLLRSALGDGVDAEPVGLRRLVDHRFCRRAYCIAYDRTVRWSFPSSLVFPVGSSALLWMNANCGFTCACWGFRRGGFDEVMAIIDDPGRAGDREASSRGSDEVPCQTQTPSPV